MEFQGAYSKLLGEEETQGQIKRTAPLDLVCRQCTATDLGGELEAMVAQAGCSD